MSTALKITLEPPFEEWSAVLSANLETGAARALRLGKMRVSEIRTAVFKAAYEYTEYLYSVATRAGITLRPVDPSCFDQSKGIVMAGHQPVIYHPGLLFKNEHLSRLSAETGAIGINVIIDTDEGDAGRLVWPIVHDTSLSLRSASIVESEGLFAIQRLVGAQQIREIFSDMAGDLRSSGLEQGSLRCEAASEMYQALAGESIAVANSIVRWAHEKRGYLEVPLSQVLKIPAAQALLLSWAQNHEELVQSYNATLEEYRAAHKIKNPANPFPNMKVDGNGIELPFWLVGPAGREAIRLRSDQALRVPDGSYLAPRGGIVTLLLRGLCSDIFIHGRGGATYDPFVDQLALRYLGVELSRFTVASCTRYLFPERLAAIEEAIVLKARFKEIVSHTAKFLGQGFFSPEEELALRELSDERGVLLKRLQVSQISDDRSKASHALNDLNKRLKGFIETSSLKARCVDAELPEVVVARWRYREYPFFLWAPFFG